MIVTPGMPRLRTLLALSLLFACGSRAAKPVAIPPVAETTPSSAGDAAHADVRPAAQEDTTFFLYSWERRVGEERVRVHTGVTPEVRSLLVTAYRGGRAPLATTFTLGEDGLPRRLAMWGMTSSLSEVDLEIIVEGGQVRVREGSGSRTMAAPPMYFTAAGSAPMAVKEALIAAWHRHGRLETIPLLPRGSASLQKQGDDVFVLGEQQIELERLELAGVKWGREVLWIDAQQRLVAVVTNDALLGQFSAVRASHEPLVGQFNVRAAAEGMARLAGQAGAPIREGRYALVHARLVDGTGAPPVDDAVIMIDDGTIVSAGRGRVPEDVPTLDARGQTVLPGLWDMHAHLSQVEWGPIYLAAGVTTVRDLGNSLSFVSGLRGAQLAPRILCAGLVDGPDGDAAGDLVLRTAADVAPVIDQIKAAGCSQVKIYNSVDPALVAPLAREAHRRGLTVTGHLPRRMALRDAVAAGFDMIDHIDPVFWSILPEGTVPDLGSPEIGALDPDSARARSIYALLARRKIVLDPTLALIEIFTLGWSAEPRAAKAVPEFAALWAGLGTPGAAPEELAAMRTFNDKLVALVGALHRAGVVIVAGTDQSVPGHSLHRELELFVKAGMTPLAAIQSATSVPARVMELEREVGTITPGKRADLILVDGDPLANISDLRRITTVITAGRAYETATLWPLAGFKP